MSNKASSIIHALRHSFPRVLSLARFGKRYGVGRARVRAWEHGTIPAPSSQEKLFHDGVCEPTDWFVEAELPVRCKICERPFADPVVQGCIDSGCPRRFFIADKSPPDPGVQPRAGSNGGGGVTQPRDATATHAAPPG